MNKLLIVGLCSLILCGALAIAGVITTNTYSTTFPLTEPALHENSHWANGGNTGTKWANVSTRPGLAYGNEGTVIYSDATAILQNNLTWANDQTATATVFQVPNTTQPNCYQEVELRLRSHIVLNSITGYEINYKVSKESYAYMQIVRWNGPLGNFTVLVSNHGSQYGVQNGDVISASIVGNVIKAYKNGVLMEQATDSTFASGYPGIGFNLSGANNQSNGQSCLLTHTNYGFSQFSAVSSRVWF